MRYTVDIVKKEITIFNYNKKWKKYLAALHKIYDKKNYEFIDIEWDQNLPMEIKTEEDGWTTIKTMPWTGTSATLTGGTITTTSGTYTDIDPLYIDTTASTSTVITKGYIDETV